MVAPTGGVVRLQVVFGDERSQLGDGGGFVIIGADMHDLGTLPLFDGEELDIGEIEFFLGTGRLDCPVEGRLINEVRHPDAGDEAEAILTGEVDGLIPLLPPEALQWRDNKIKVTRDLVGSLLAHLDRIGDAVELLD